MNKILSQTLMFISTVFALGIISISVKADVNIYRLYNTTNLDHLWTTGTSEIFSLVKSSLPTTSGATASPSAWYGDEIAFTEPSSGTPVYRLNSTGSAGHLFTTDITEVSTLTSSGKWSNEGIAFYSGGTIPVYRLYNSQGYHFFTTDSTEESNLVSAGWTYQKVAFYATGGARVYKGDSFGTPTADISGDITLSGTGAGYQAKIGMQDL